MVEGASLESLYVGNCIVGSNPILSANNSEKSKMSRNYKFNNSKGLCFISFAVVELIIMPEKKLLDNVCAFQYF